MLVAQCRKCKSLIEVEQRQQTVRCLSCGSVLPVGRVGQISLDDEQVDVLVTLHAIIENQKRVRRRLERTPHG
jgi:DNA-directed RNA polymerase subunit RPC12/RpoP